MALDKLLKGISGCSDSSTTYFLVLADFLGEFSFVLHLFDACVVEDIKFLLVQLGLLCGDQTFLLKIS